jgi:hypothetical protein
MKPLKLFYSYSHADESLRNELEKHLTLLRREGHIENWHDRRILPGKNLDDEISENLESASIILLLVSADFISSEYCYSKEMMRALQKEAGGEAQVVPVILRPCDWHSAPFGKLNALPPDGAALTSFANRDEGFVLIAKGLRRLINVVKSEKEDAASSERSASPAESLVKKVLLPKKFTDFDKDQFIKGAFKQTMEIFKSSLSALERDNPGYQTAFEQIDSQKFEAAVYRHGALVAKCFIRLGNGWGGSTQQILYSSGGNAGFSGNSFNKALDVECAADRLYLKSTFALVSNDNMGADEAAEFLWNDFVSSIRE